MPKAFVLVNIKSSTEEMVGKALRESRNVAEAHFIYGVYDFIATVVAPTTDELKASVIALRKIPEITSTLTMMVIE
ncbi:MAG: Lrp/AsnC family transcriptional regulator [Nitrososphaerales archaeon]